MSTPIYNFLSKDHRRIEELFSRATADPKNVLKEVYHQFRVGLLTHIKMEENILFPYAKKANGGKHLPMVKQFRLEHGAVTSLMVNPPTPELIKVLSHVMDVHDFAEEKEGGLYEVLEKLTQAETAEIIDKLEKITEVPVHPHNEAEYALEVTKRTLARAGYDFDEIAKS